MDETLTTSEAPSCLHISMSQLAKYRRSIIIIKPESLGAGDSSHSTAMTRSPQSGLAKSLAELAATSLCLTSLWLNHDLLPCHLPTAPAPMHLTSNDPLHLSMTSPALLPSHKPICKVAVFRQRHTCTGLPSGGLSSTGNLPDVQGLHLVLPARNISMRY